MKNTLSDLNNYLFESLERLMDDELSEEEFQREATRSKAVTDVATNIIQASDLSLKAVKLMYDCGMDVSAKKIPLFEDKNE